MRRWLLNHTLEFIVRIQPSHKGVGSLPNPVLIGKTRFRAKPQRTTNASASSDNIRLF